jgi:AcrR family transcriptional regulator
MSMALPAESRGRPSASHRDAPTRRLPRAERREQIARTAATVFVRGGFDGTSMDDVAREAGVTRLIVYRIFESKEELYRAVLELVIDDLATSFEGPLQAPRDPADHQHSIGGTLLGVARRHPDAFRLLWRHAAHEPAFREVAALFKSAVTEYAIALFGPSLSDETIRRWAAESVVSHLYESVCLWLDDGDEARDSEFLALLTEGIRAMVIRWIEISRPTT